MNQESLGDLVNKFRVENDSWTKRSKLFDAPWEEGLYHYTSGTNLENIKTSQTFWASFIRSTSDPLEFMYPMVNIRDWVMKPGNIFKKDANQDDLHKLFNFFNQESDNPSMRPYFISLCPKPDNPLLKNRYGKIRLTFEDFHSNTFHVNQDGTAYLVQIKYVADMSKCINHMLNQWYKEVFQKIRIKKLNPSDGSDWEIIATLMHLWMKTFLLISLSVKTQTYKDEIEHRLVFFPSPHKYDKETDWHLPRKIRSSDIDAYGFPKTGEPRRECLPIKLSIFKNTTWA